jgi:hypothetical protein
LKTIIRQLSRLWKKLCAEMMAQHMVKPVANAKIALFSLAVMMARTNVAASRESRMN